MIEIDIKELKKNIDGLGALINEYEGIKSNLFNHLKESCISWQDNNSLEFDNNIQLDKKEINLYIDSLKSRKSVFDYIYDKYSEIGKKIYCNLNNKNSLLSNIDNCYNQCVSILDDFNRIDRSFYYSEQNSISNQKNKIIEVKNQLEEIKSSVSKMYIRIENIEKVVSSKIKELEEIKINNFDYILL